VRKERERVREEVETRKRREREGLRSIGSKTRVGEGTEANKLKVEHRVVQRQLPWVFALLGKQCDTASHVAAGCARCAVVRWLWGRTAEKIPLDSTISLLGVLLGCQGIGCRLAHEIRKVVHIPGTEVVDVVVHALAKLLCVVDGKGDCDAITELGAIVQGVCEKLARIGRWLQRWEYPQVLRSLIW
jgi:hypothetical protein